MRYSYSKEMFIGRADPIRIIGGPDKWSSIVCSTLGTESRKKCLFEIYHALCRNFIDDDDDDNINNNDNNNNRGIKTLQYKFTSCGM